MNKSPRYRQDHTVPKRAVMTLVERILGILLVGKLDNGRRRLVPTTAYHANGLDATVYAKVVLDLVAVNVGWKARDKQVPSHDGTRRAASAKVLSRLLFAWHGGLGSRATATATAATTTTRT